MFTEKRRPSFTMAEILVDAVEKPGKILEAYSNFHSYSLGNMLAACYQAAALGIDPGPIGTYTHWKQLGRQVKRGAKAIFLCQPVTIRKKADGGDTDALEESAGVITLFQWSPKWFLLSQTDGPALEEKLAPRLWDATDALKTLGIERVPFTHPDGNVQGYAKDNTIAINPVAQLPVKTMFHELAHIILGHTKESGVDDSDITPRSLREVEAESVALICLESLGLEGAEYCRGYIQNWLGKQTIPEKSAHKIFKAADTILKAGQIQEKTGATTPPKKIPAAQPVDQALVADAKPTTKTRHGVPANDRQALLDQLVLYWVEATPDTAEQNIAVRYASTTYTIKHSRLALERVMIALGFRKQLETLASREVLFRVHTDPYRTQWPQQQEAA